MRVVLHRLTPLELARHRCTVAVAVTAPEVVDDDVVEDEATLSVIPLLFITKDRTLFTKEISHTRNGKHEARLTEVFFGAVGRCGRGCSAGRNGGSPGRGHRRLVHAAAASSGTQTSGRVQGAVLYCGEIGSKTLSSWKLGSISMLSRDFLSPSRL